MAGNFGGLMVLIAICQHVFHQNMCQLLHNHTVVFLCKVRLQLDAPGLWTNRRHGVHHRQLRTRTLHSRSFGHQRWEKAALGCQLKGRQCERHRVCGRCEDQR